MEITRSAYPALFQVADASSVSGQRACRWLVQIELAPNTMWMARLGRIDRPGARERAP